LIECLSTLQRDGDAYPYVPDTKKALLYWYIQLVPLTCQSSTVISHVQTKSMENTGKRRTLEMALMVNTDTPTLVSPRLSVVVGTRCCRLGLWEHSRPLQVWVTGAQSPTFVGNERRIREKKGQRIKSQGITQTRRH